MQVTSTAIPDVLILEPEIIQDYRGFFYESFNKRKLSEIIGGNIDFVQDNNSMSIQNVIRGLHYQIDQPQGKLIRVIQGEIFDVAVDIRRSSPTFGKHVSAIISATNKRILWIPPGFAHGFLVLSKHAEISYKLTDYWAPEKARAILWNDQDLNIPWPLNGKPILSNKDQTAKYLKEAEYFQFEIK